ncbi:30S ribosomal protein S4 [Patescibacteria group bacterium]|nr:30S ribosomal protein S4 [Patescibacteria group bacterium]
MARNLDPKCKQCRRESNKLFLKGEKCFSPKCPMLKRNYFPGVHGPGKKRFHISSYGRQLREKQKAKRTYRLLEKQFKNYYTKASRQSGDTSENFLRLLETRLDNIVYYLGFALSRDAARQLVNHGHILVDNKKVTIPSYQVKVGQEISFNKNILSRPVIKERLEKLNKVQVAGWLALDAALAAGKIVSLPKKEELALAFDPTLIIEYYSR